jgi:dTDP-4-amino-4,6-dideoxygalactose transaminase
MNVFSFHTMKNMSTLGEGGAITTDDESLIPLLKELRQFGGRGWGSNYKMSKCQAAVGLVQLQKLDDMIGARQRLARARHELLEGCPHLTLPVELAGHEHSYYLYSILVAKAWEGEKRDQLRTILLEEYGVNTEVANAPVQNSIPYLAKLTEGQDLPKSQELGRRLFCPPIHPAMSEEDNAYISAAIWETVARVQAQG